MPRHLLLIPLSGAEGQARLTEAGRCAIESEYRKLGDTPFITLNPRMPTCGLSLNAATTLGTRGLRRTASLPHEKVWRYSASLLWLCIIRHALLGLQQERWSST